MSCGRQALRRTDDENCWPEDGNQRRLDLVQDPGHWMPRGSVPCGSVEEAAEASCGFAAVGESGYVGVERRVAGGVSQLQDGAALNHATASTISIPCTGISRANLIPFYAR